MFAATPSAAVAGSGVAGDMRRHQHLRMVPERAAGRQRLLAEHVQRGAAEMAGVERLDQVVLDQVLAARDVDHAGAVRQLGEGGGIQDADGLRGERQQADQDVGAVQEGVQLAAAGDS